ncbi:uncharacterized protein LOC128657265 [Bombina bombina]|uniref:uncharacterized protein LOC128657265 n=1 Tax=Bombina bombina TaxID=8345 RepID=UPI00235AC23E|nr:uncharacterized protein LOC128657265 [Bombina bombina]
MSEKHQDKPTTSKNIVVSMKEGSVTESVIDPVVPTSSISAMCLPSVVTCQCCGHSINTSKRDVYTNTETIVQDKAIQFDRKHGSKSTSTQTDFILPRTNASTSTIGLKNTKDAYSWTMGDITGNKTLTSIGTWTGPDNALEINTMDEHLQPLIVNMSPIFPSSPMDINDEATEDMMLDSELLNETVASSQFVDNSILKDPNYSPDTSMTTADEYSILKEKFFDFYVREKKYLVFESCLDELLHFLPCSQKDCSAPIISKEKRILGTLLIVTGECLSGHEGKLWYSQPKIQQMPIGNLLYSASILFSGNNFEKVSEFSEYLGLQSISSQTYYKIQKKFLFPTVELHWVQDRQKNINSFRDRAITLCGDGQCDSPGYCAKYCTYTMIEDESKKIIDLNIVQVTEASSSVAMESKAFRRAMNNIAIEQLMVLQIATDRHVSIRKFLREQYPVIKHQFDIWHYGKSIRKKLISLSRKKNCK